MPEPKRTVSPRALPPPKATPTTNRKSINDRKAVATLLQKQDQRYARYLKARNQKFHQHLTNTKTEMRTEYNKVMGKLEDINQMLAKMIK
jgi:hypothetical protein